MKFVIVVVMLALALGAQSSVVPWGVPLSYTAVSGPTIIAAAPSAIPAAIAIHESPAVIAAAPAVVAAPVIAAEGSYVAKTRGAVHVAPLPGHLNSAASINLEPAPGTI